MSNETPIILTILVVCVDLGLTVCRSGIYGIANDPTISTFLDGPCVYETNVQLRIFEDAIFEIINLAYVTSTNTSKYSIVLEKKAQEVANTCEFQHVAIKGTQWRWVGQNLYLSMSTAKGNGSNWQEAIQSWFDEHKSYKFGAPSSKNTGEYTQLVWADSDNVGCGYTYYKKDGQIPYQKFYVCNYGPGGNIIGQNPYKTE